ncbi:structural maintenance of chromosomes protein 1B-like isoform X1 [Cynocephalus volans]|uniref:structural maintenance of chromosomes protein 1B-like isoform X1 n=1 Tax=Cynocephalus volans TaxID=110931 RepID=UPI002FC93D80
MGVLQVLIVENFKSWRGRQVIGPFKRFTCIIGPNNSGKSNVMDALRFVMGEKAANLRVKNIQDLIHGAHIGKPISSSASVKIVYVEESGEEKTFTRIIRGGCSEFHCDDNPVSRSAYTAELEKIGITVKARHCLVFQESVESISMKKPKERTKFFEEISSSGELIGEYKEKKRKLQKAEEDAQSNFNKKKSVAAECKQAQLEKEEADRYHSLLEELKVNKIQLHLFQLYHNEKKICFLNSALERVNRDLSVTKESLSHHANRLKAKKKERGMLTEQLQQTENELKSLEALLNEKKLQYIKAKESISHHLEKLDVAKKSVKHSEKQCSKHEDEIGALEAELVDLDGAWRSFENQIEKELVSKLRDLKLEDSKLDRYDELKEEVRTKAAITIQQLEKLQWEQKAEEDSLAFEKRRHGEVQGNLKQVKEQIEDHKKRIEKLEEDTKTCMDRLKEKKEQEETLVVEIDKAKSRMSEVNEELDLIESELQNDGIDDHERRCQQKRAEILNRLSRLYPDSVFGRLLDLCHPIHKKYQLAVTKLLGQYMFAIVVASVKIAKDCIQFLKEERAESETFLALDYLEIKPINEKLREIKGCKMAIDVIRTQFPQLKKVIEFVCGNGLVCETVEEARSIAFDGPERRKTVALDGTLFLKSGVISGGSSDLKDMARCWDEKELTNLRVRRSQLIQELKDLMKTLYKETDLKQLQTLVQGTHALLQYSQMELQMIKKHRATFYQEQSQLQSELLNIECQCTKLNEGIKERQQRIKEFQEKINEVEDDIFQHFCEEIGVKNIREFENKPVKQDQEMDQKRLEFERQKARLNIQLKFSRNELNKNLNKVNALKKGIEKRREYIDNLNKAEENCRQILEELMAKRQQLKDVLITQNSNTDKAQTQIEEERKKFLAVERQVGKLEKEVVLIQTSVEKKQLKKHDMLVDCKVQNIEIILLFGSLDDITELELGSEAESAQTTTGICEKEEAIEIDYSSLSEDLKALQSDQEVKAHLRFLLQQIASQEAVLCKRGVPYRRAQENLKTLRHKFQECTDAFEASTKEATMCRQEFEQVKKRRYDLFSQCFEHVSTSIDQIYKKLCGNNSAQAFLILENPEEPYLEGITYSCMAAGKRFMLMEDLSRGEKCVAALALLFAVYSFQPAPFFVLNEVDAVLDNTNIGKVTSYIKEQSQTQFQMIIISLKEEFFSKADAVISICPEYEDCMFS